MQQEEHCFIIQDISDIKNAVCKVPHTYRTLVKKSQYTDDVISLWDRDSPKKIGQVFVNKLKEHLEKAEHFFTIHPPSKVDRFVNDMQKWIQKVFPKSEDISHYFTKTPGFSIGAKENQEKSVKELLQHFWLTEELPEKYTRVNTLVFYDDVYSSGKTTKVMIELLKRNGVKPSRLIKGYICRMQSNADRFA